MEERPSPHRTRKIDLEEWCYIPQRRGRNSRNIQENCFKKSISKRFWCKKRTMKIFCIFGPNGQCLTCNLIIFHAWWTHSSVKCWLSRIFTNYLRYSIKFSRIFIPFPIVHLELSQFWKFSQVNNIIRVLLKKSMRKPFRKFLLIYSVPPYQLKFFKESWVLSRNHCKIYSIFRNVLEKRIFLARKMWIFRKNGFIF